MNWFCAGLLDDCWSVITGGVRGLHKPGLKNSDEAYLNGDVFLPCADRNRLYRASETYFVMKLP